MTYQKHLNQMSDVEIVNEIEAIQASWRHEVAGLFASPTPGRQISSEGKFGKDQIQEAPLLYKPEKKFHEMIQLLSHRVKAGHCNAQRELQFFVSIIKLKVKQR